MSIDRHGFRNGIDAKAWEKEHKIMLIGDSVGFGSGLDDPYTISNYLNRISPNENLGFLNLCNPAYDTIPLLSRLYQYGGSLGPWKLIFWMYSINDAKYSIRYYPLSRQTIEPAKPNNFDRLKNFIIFKWPHAVIRRYKYHKSAQEIKKDPKRSSWSAYYNWCLSSYRPGSVTRRNEKAYIRDIITWGNNNKTPIIFIVFPAENQLTDGNKLPQEFIQELGRELGFPVIDLIPYFIKAQEKRRLYLPKDHTHLNKEGSKLVATIISDWLRRNGYL